MIMHPWRPSLLRQQLAQQTLGRLPVAPALDEHVEHEAILIDGPPQPMLAPAIRRNPGSVHAVERAARLRPRTSGLEAYI